MEEKYQRYDDVSCPNIVEECNSHMGEIDFMDSLIGCYKMRIKTCNVFYHVLDLAMTNTAIILRHKWRKKISSMKI